MNETTEPHCLVQVTVTAGMPPLENLRTLIVTSLPGLPDQTVSDIEVVATELLTNAYLHGRPPAHFSLFRLDPTRLRVEVVDGGDAMPQVMHPDISDEHGRGLLLVAGMSASWGVMKTGAGKTVWAEFVVPRIH